MRDLQDLRRALLEPLTAASPTALCTIVATAGSSYRKAGARMLVTASGRQLGLLSGGCIDADVCLAGTEVIASGQSRLVEFDLSLDTDSPFSYGTGCPGTIWVWIERLPPQLSALQIDEILAFPAAAPRRQGLIYASQDARFAAGQRWTEGASLSSNLAPLSNHMRSLAFTSGPQGLCIDLGTGLVQVLIELIAPMTTVHIFGAGPDAEILMNILRQLGWDVHVYDHRPGFLRPEAFAEACLHHIPSYGCAWPKPTVTSKSAFVLMTHNFDKDLELLTTLLPLAPPYLGILGAKKRTVELFKSYRSSHSSSAAALSRICSPIGLDLGGSDPSSISLAIAAEISMVLAGASGLPKHLPLASP